MSKIHISKSGEPPVQYSEPEVQSMFRSGQLDGEALYWKEGMSDWKKVRELFPQPVEAGPTQAPTPNRAASAAPIPASPYAPPVADPLPAPVPLEARNGYAFTKDPRGLTAALKVMLWVNVVTAGLSLLSDLLQLKLASAGEIAMDAAEANDSRQALIALLYLGAFLATAIIFGMWIYRANLNSRGFGAAGMRFTPGWSVGCFFIPILNLFRPFQAMKEIWQVSGNPRRWETEPAGGILSLWWTLWILSNILGQAVFRMSMNADTPEELQVATSLSVFASIMDIPLSIVAIKMVSTIHARQVRLTEGNA